MGHASAPSPLAGHVRELLPGRVGELESAVRAQIPRAGRLGIAYSGGVDSATLLALAVRALGASNVVGILGVSPSLATSERTLAHEVARRIGAEVIEVKTGEGSNPAYVANGPDRCFHCKDALFTTIDDEVRSRFGLDAVAYGENADDALRPDRPGSQAATDHRVLRPLAAAGLTKADVREVARALGIQVADKPAAPCLASRIPHGQEVTPEKLAQIERAEAVLWELGFRDGRVRHHGEVARVELPAEDLPAAVAEPVRTRLVNEVRGAGFRFVTIDLGGIQSGAFTLPLVSVTSGRRSR